MDKSSNQATIHLCTLFDSNFLAQGLALIESVEAKASGQVSWTILALDSLVGLKLNSLSKQNISVIQFIDFEDAELRTLVGERPWREICWTSAACLLRYCLNSKVECSFVGYVDADCFFVGDIFKMVSEIPESKNIAIHEHRYSPDRIDWLPKSGRFNVGVVIGRPGTEFNTCIEIWRQQVLHRCDVDMSEGRCGDQTYLNDWPEKFESLYIFENPGIGLAPWNLNNYEIISINNQLFIGKSSVFFFHFHGLQFKLIRSLVIIYVAASGYQIRILPIKEIYNPYVSRILSNSVNFGLRSHQINLRQDFMWVIRNTLKGHLKIARKLSK